MEILTRLNALTSWLLDPSRDYTWLKTADEITAWVSNHISPKMSVITYLCINIRLTTYTDCIYVEYRDTDKQLRPTEHYAMRLYIHALSRTGKEINIAVMK